MVTSMVHEHSDDRERTILLSEHFGHLKHFILFWVKLFETFHWLFTLWILLFKEFFKFVSLLKVFVILLLVLVRILFIATIWPFLFCSHGHWWLIFLFFYNWLWSFWVFFGIAVKALKEAICTSIWVDDIALQVASTKSVPFF